MKNILLIVIATAFALVCAEGVLRILEPRTDSPINHVIETEAGSYTVPIPDAKRTELGRAVSVNALGYRGFPYPPERSTDAFRIQVFGDSHTFGIGAPDGQSYPAVMEQVLNLKQPRVEVLNFGVGGHDFTSMEKHMSVNVPRYRPDLVVFTFHAGDIISTDVIINKQATRDVPFLVWLNHELISRSYFARLASLYGASAVRSLFGIQPPGTTVAEIKNIEQDDLQWKNFKAAMLRLDEELGTRCTRLVVVLFPTMLDFDTTPEARLHELIKSWLVENDIAVLDLLPAFQESGRQASDFWATLLDHHPDEEGYAIAGEAVARYIDPIVRQKRPGGGGECQGYAGLQQGRHLPLAYLSVR